MIIYKSRNEWSYKYEVSIFLYLYLIDFQNHVLSFSSQSSGSHWVLFQSSLIRQKASEPKGELVIESDKWVFFRNFSSSQYLFLFIFFSIIRDSLNLSTHFISEVFWRDHCWVLTFAVLVKLIPASFPYWTTYCMLLIFILARSFSCNTDLLNYWRNVFPKL